MIATERLLLRQWEESDRAPWAAMNADPAVREFFPSVLTREESDAAFDRISSGLNERGWGLWAVEADGAFLGFTGLAQPDFRAEREIGWRFARAAWGNGYATEAARPCSTMRSRPLTSARSSRSRRWATLRPAA